MFIFLIALKSKSAPHNWQKTTQLLAQTLGSIQNQSDNNYRIIIVCNEKPAIANDKIDWVLTDILSPDLESAFYLKERDRAKKLLIGFNYAKQYSPSYLMPVDADDFVSKNIVKYANGNDNSNGYYLGSGYIFEQGNDLIHISHGFENYCGTSLILKSDTFLDYFGGGVYLHNKTGKLDLLPFDGAIYNRCNGENFAAIKTLQESMGRADPKFDHIPITDKILTTFNFRIL